MFSFLLTLLNTVCKIFQNESLKDENDEENIAGNTPWKKQLTTNGDIRNRVWPPIENIAETEEISTGILFFIIINLNLKMLT